MGDVDINRLMAQMRTLAGEVKTPKQTSGVSDGSEKNSSAPDFSALLKASLDNVQGNQATPGVPLKAKEVSGSSAVSGGQVSLDQVMMDVQKARDSFQEMSRVRSKLVTAYQNVLDGSTDKKR
jgi:flagellar hook-basal body complex protein FliE